MAETRSVISDPVRGKVIAKFWPIAVLFFAIFIPISFLVLDDYFGGYMLLGAFLFFVTIMFFYFQKKNIKFISHALASLGIPVLFPWLISGGPSGAGFWWSIVYVIWAFFVAGKGPAILWLSVHLVISTTVGIFSIFGFIKIGYPLSELLNILFAYILTFVLVFLFDQVREYYLKLSLKRAEEISKVNEELLTANNELEQFAFIASHDLQEPLRTISNFVGLLEEKLKDDKDEETKVYLKFTSGATFKMQNLIKDLLFFSRIGSSIAFESVNCNEILKEVIAEMDTSIKERNAKITSEKLPVLQANQWEIKQLFQNLISNGIKFRKKDTIPEISISVTKIKTEYLFAIRDNGIGIEEQYKDHIFIIFKRLYNESEYPGTGIGLANCKKIVAQHNGKIWVESEPGIGSTFYFTLADGNK